MSSLLLLSASTVVGIPMSNMNLISDTMALGKHPSKIPTIKRMKEKKFRLLKL